MSASPSSKKDVAIAASRMLTNAAHFHDLLNFINLSSMLN